MALQKLQKRATDQGITLSFLLPLISTWLTSEFPRDDLTEIWDSRLEEYGYGSVGANAPLLEDTLYGGRWYGGLIYSPLPLIADVICNLDNSEQGVEGIEDATQALCTIPGSGSSTKRSNNSIAPRRLVVTTTADRSDNGVEPSVAYAIQGILDVSMMITS